jgi:hypothetical protein
VPKRKYVLAIGPDSDPLTEVLRNEAGASLAQSVGAGLATLLRRQADKLTGDGRARLVHFGDPPERDIMTVVPAPPR